MALVLGLGNPGPRYRLTRHNVGWRVLEALAVRWGAVEGEPAAEYRSWSARSAGRDVALVQPLTFMNASGEALAAWRDRHGLGPAGLLVVTDDVYLPLGALRLRARGGHGGHQGLASVEQVLQTREYARLRIGVGAAESAAGLRDHVLEEFSAEERPQVDEMLTKAAEAVECWLADGVLAAMNRFNRRVSKEVPEP